MSRFRSFRLPAALCCLLIAFAVLLGGGPAAAATANQPVAARQATPTTWSCDTTGTPAATPAMPTMNDEATPTSIDFDQTYIDMMLPHHASVIALAEAALPRLENADLQTIATNIISSQSAERTELTAYREQFYGSATPAPMDAVMNAMATSMPEAHDLMMADMAMMDSDALVAEFCGQSDADLAFIDLVIPHHQAAISASRVAVAQAVHPEIREFANQVIVAQQAEVEQMTSIRAMLTGPATTPAA